MSPLEPIAAAVTRALEGPCGVAVGTPVVAACSGGADSVALVYALAAQGARWPLVSVVFVDHGLRDTAADRAAARAAAVAARRPFDAVSVTVAEAGNLQASARAARYEALLCRVPDGGVLATGHTRSDQAETVLQRLVRGAGLRGLAAIPWRDGPVVRPLLGVGRAATRGAGLPFADDPSNASPDQARVELELVDALAEVVDLGQASLAGLPAEVAAVIARWRHRREIGGPPPRRAAVDALARRLSAGDTTAVSLGRGIRAEARRGRLRFATARDPRSEVVAWGPGTYRLATLRLELVVSDRPPSRGAADDPLRLRLATLRWPLRVMVSRAGRGDAGAAGWPPPRHTGRRSTWSGPDNESLVILDAIGEKVGPTPACGVGASEDASATWLEVRIAKAETEGTEV